MGQLALGYIEFFASLTDLMGRIGDHLPYLSKYATGFQDSDEMQEVSVQYIANLQYLVLLPIGL